MSISILDTNVLLRFLVGDNKAQKTKAIEWFREATQGKQTILVKPVVIAEAIFVLESFYKHSRETIMSSMLPFLAMPVLHVEDRDALLHLWNDFLGGLHFVDAYLLSSARLQNAEILTFDKQLLNHITDHA